MQQQTKKTKKPKTKKQKHTTMMSRCRASWQYIYLYNIR